METYRTVLTIAANNSLDATHLEGSFRVVLYFFSLIIRTLENNLKIL
jgi:hypothetical protein